METWIKAVDSWYSVPIFNLLLFDHSISLFAHKKMGEKNKHYMFFHNLYTWSGKGEKGVKKEETKENREMKEKDNEKKETNNE